MEISKSGGVPATPKAHVAPPQADEAVQAPVDAYCKSEDGALDALSGLARAAVQKLGTGAGLPLHGLSTAQAVSSGCGGGTPKPPSGGCGSHPAPAPPHPAPPHPAPAPKPPSGGCGSHPAPKPPRPGC